MAQNSVNPLNDPLLFAVHHNQCDPKKCTSLKLKKFNLLKIVPKINLIPRRAIILDPFSDKILSADDRELLLNYGLVVIDCSWNKADFVFQTKFSTGRKLPELLAANSVNYGKWNKLCSAEALAAALIITGFVEKSQEILSKFVWGNTFIEINRNFFDDFIERIN
jgi:pre-rRNA-processing protein TSR3